MSARFIVPVSDSTEASFRLKDRFFQYRSFDSETEADLLTQTEKIFIKQYTVISTDHDDYGSTTGYYQHCIRLSELHSLSEISDTRDYFGDIIVTDGRVEGIILYLGYPDRRIVDKKYQYWTPLCQAAECDQDHFAFLYTDGRKEGCCELRYSTSSDRSESDHSICYSLMDQFVPDWNNSSWD